jgi:hypothetical protein
LRDIRPFGSKSLEFRILGVPHEAVSDNYCFKRDELSPSASCSFLSPSLFLRLAVQQPRPAGYTSGVFGFLCASWCNTLLTVLSYADWSCAQKKVISVLLRLIRLEYSGACPMRSCKGAYNPLPARASQLSCCALRDTYAHVGSVTAEEGSNSTNTVFWGWYALTVAWVDGMNKVLGLFVQRRPRKKEDLRPFLTHNRS